MSPAAKPRDTTKSHLSIKEPLLLCAPLFAPSTPDTFARQSTPPPVIASVRRGLDGIRARLRAKEIDKQECRRRLAACADDFWVQTIRQTPLITPDPQDDGHVLVTFLWRDRRARAVLFFAIASNEAERAAGSTASSATSHTHRPPRGSSSATAPVMSLMKHFGGTDIWHISWRVAADRHISYCFLPCARKGNMPCMSGMGTREDQEAIRMVLTFGKPDPRNPPVRQGPLAGTLSVIRPSDVFSDIPGSHLAATPRLTSGSHLAATAHEAVRPTVQQMRREKLYGKEQPQDRRGTSLTPPKTPRPSLAPRVKTTVTAPLKSTVRAIRAKFRQRAIEIAGEQWPAAVHQQNRLIAATDTAKQQRLINAAVDDFWAHTARQTPVIIPEPASRHHALVTFLWRDRRARAVLLFANRITDEKNLKESLMTRIGHTDVWHITYRMETDWRASYCFIPCYDKKGLADITGVHQTSIRRALDRGLADVRNPLQCKNRAGNVLSVVELKDAPPQPWLGCRSHAAYGNVSSHGLSSGHTVWVYEPPYAHGEGDGQDAGVLVMFDGDMWMCTERFNETLDNLINAGRIPPLYALLVETDNIAARWDALSEESGVEGFVADNLLVWARKRWPITCDPSRTIVAGQSLGALSALWVAARRPESVGNVIAQSASLWRGSIMERPNNGRASCLGTFTGRLYLECGRQEWALLPLHKKFARMLAKDGCTYNYVEYNGGHDYACWRGGMADGLCWVTDGWK